MARWHEQFSIPRGYKFMAVINPTANTVWVYQNHITTFDERYALVRVFPYSQRTIPISETLFQFSVEWDDDASSEDVKKLDFIFSIENLQLNGSLGGAQYLDVNIIGDTLGLAREEQFPAALVGGRLAVVSTLAAGSEVALAPGAEVALAPGAEVALAAGATVDVGNFPSLTIDQSIATILISETESASVAIQEGHSVTGLFMPAAWTAADLTIKVSLNDIDFFDVYDGAGAAVTLQVDAGQYIRLNPSDWVGIPYLLFVSSVAQAAEREIVVISRAV